MNTFSTESFALFGRDSLENKMLKNGKIKPNLSKNAMQNTNLPRNCNLINI